MGRLAKGMFYLTYPRGGTMAPEGYAPNGVLQRLLDITLSDGGYVVSLVEAYFDESGTGAESRFLCVAGYIFTKERAVALAADWQAMLARIGVSYFRMVDCAHGAGEFAKLSPGARDNAARQAIALTKRHALRGIALSLDKVAFSQLPPQAIWNTPYSFLAGQVLYGIRKWADENGHSDRVSYIYEAGAHGAGDLVEAFAKIKRTPDLAAEYRIGGVSFLEKTEKGAEPLQCADLLAWHWNTYNKRLADRLALVLQESCSYDSFLNQSRRRCGTGCSATRCQQLGQASGV